MKLSRVEMERISDSRLKLQSVANSLKHIDPKKIQNFKAIEECLGDAQESLGGALRSSDS